MTKSNQGVQKVKIEQINNALSMLRDHPFMRITDAAAMHAISSSTLHSALRNPQSSLTHIQLKQLRRDVEQQIKNSRYTLDVIYEASKRETSTEHHLNNLWRTFLKLRFHINADND